MSWLHCVAFFPQCLQTVSLHKLVAEKCSCHMPVITRGDCKHCASLIELKAIEHDRFQRKHIISLKPGGCPCEFIPYDTNFFQRKCVFDIVFLRRRENIRMRNSIHVCGTGPSVYANRCPHVKSCGYRWVLYITLQCFKKAYCIIHSPPGGVHVAIDGYLINSALKRRLPSSCRHGRSGNSKRTRRHLQVWRAHGGDHQTRELHFGMGWLWEMIGRWLGWPGMALYGDVIDARCPEKITHVS